MTCCLYHLQRVQRNSKMSEEQSVQEVRGESGEVGTATAALLIKQQWHEKHFKLVSTKDQEHPNRKSYQALPGAPSLKQFARGLLKANDPVAQAWFANKTGEQNQKTSEANLKAARETALATKLSRKKTKGGAKKAETPAV
jgi:hypothetical protein